MRQCQRGVWCFEWEKQGLWGVLGFVPVYSTSPDQALLCPSAAAEVLAGASTEKASNSWAQGHRLSAITSCNHLEQLMPPEHNIASRAAEFSLASGKGTCGLVHISPAQASPVSLQTSFAVDVGYTLLSCCCQHGLLFREISWCMWVLHTSSHLHKAALPLLWWDPWSSWGMRSVLTAP